MSSTNRGGSRIADDVYETPSWAVRRLLEAYDFSHARTLLEPFAGSGKIVQAHRAVCSARLIPARNWPRWTVVELRESCHLSLSRTLYGGDISGGSVYCPQDFFSWAAPEPYDAIITNPPFSLATEAIRACLPLAHDVAMLLRLNYWPHLPADIREPYIFVLPDRPSFTANLKWKQSRCEGSVLDVHGLPRVDKKGRPVRCDRERGHEGGDHMVIGTDSCEYAWFLWSTSESPPFWNGTADPALRRLRRTPLAERQAG